MENISKIVNFQTMNAKALPAYLAERFPPINMALFAILFCTVFAVASHFSGGLVAFQFGGREVLGMLATISFFFRLRVFDEIKDYSLDVLNHPQRVLQSGRISLRELMLLSLAGTALEIAWSYWMGLPALLGWALAAGYSLLMRYEFFVGEYLKKRLLLYAFTHMLVMPLLIFWIWSAYVPALHEALLLLALLSLLAGFSFELARKIHAPEAERPLVDSYSKAMGYNASIVAVAGVLLAGVVVQSLLLRQLAAPYWPYLLIAVLYLGTLGVYGQSIRKPQEKGLRTAEKLVSLFMLLSYVLIILLIVLA
jgi:hypothetical protein